jgi:two-component system chemotaxis response regulator CheY
MKILLVDDSKAMRSIVRRALRQAGFDGHDVTEAGDGAEALASIESSTPDLVLCDWNMPTMNGIELLKTLKERGNPPRLGFVTSESTPAMLEQAFAAGAAFFVTKPFTVESLQAALGPILR